MLLVLIVISCDTSSKVNELKKERETKSQIQSSLSGKGDKVERLSLNKGLAIFTMRHTGSRNFSVVLKYSDGEYIDLLANDVGTYSGQKTATLDKDGNYVLEVTANGSWTIDVK